MKVLVQEFNIMVDKGFLLSVYDIFAHQLADEDTVRLLLLAHGLEQDKSCVFCNCPACSCVSAQ